MAPLPTFNLTCLAVVVPIVPGVVTQIVNILLFLLSNILITALPLMLLESGMNSLMMCAVQHQLPPSSAGNGKPVTGFSFVSSQKNEIRKEYLGTGN